MKKLVIKIIFRHQKLPVSSRFTLGIPDSSCSIICVFLAILALNGVGSPKASSKEFVCRDCVPPKTAAIASTTVRMMLL